MIKEIAVAHKGLACSLDIIGLTAYYAWARAKQLG